MPPKARKKNPVKKPGRKNRKKTKSGWQLIRPWLLPLFLFLLISFSLAATFYIIFLRPASKPLFM
jgi:hypothetical protein